MEDQLIDRLSFRRFSRLLLDQTAPDFTTFWRLLEALANYGFVKKIFEEITDQLEAKKAVTQAGNRG